MSRSELLRSGADLLDALGGQDLISALTSEEIRHLSLDRVLQAFRLARDSELRNSRHSLAATGTLQKYRKTVAALTRKNRHDNPFEEYRRRSKLNLWRSKNTRQCARSALVRQAAEEIETLANFYVQDLLRDILDPRASLTVQRVYRSCFLRNATNELEPRTWEALALPDVRKLARAVAFLINYPPNPSRTGPPRQRPVALKKTRKTKRDALSGLHRHQSRKRRVDAGYDWRSHFWSAAVLPDVYISDHLRACIAAMMITGCRPSEFSDQHGVMVHCQSEEARPVLLIRIQSSKTDHHLTNAFFRGSVYKPSQTALDEGLKPTLRGQPWRQLRIVCQSPEALWLAAYVGKQYRKFGKEVGNFTGVRLVVDTPDLSPAGDWLHSSERDRRITVKLGKLTARLGKIAFPRFKALTPYVFRHAIASDLKSSDQFNSEQIAGVLGHRSTRTASAYGSIRSRGHHLDIRMHQIVSVAAPEPVRDHQSSYRLLRENQHTASLRT